jgi:hypothetical protein
VGAAARLIRRSADAQRVRDMEGSGSSPAIAGIRISSPSREKVKVCFNSFGSLCPFYIVLWLASGEPLVGARGSMRAINCRAIRVRSSAVIAPSSEAAYRTNCIGLRTRAGSTIASVSIR